MARDFDGSSANYLSNNAAAVTGPPFTMAIWAYPRSGTSFDVCIGVGDSGGTGDEYVLGVAGNVAGDPVYCHARQSASSASALGGTVNFNNWNHLCYVERTTSDREVYLGGASKGTNTTLKAPSTIDETFIGKRPNSTTENLDGYAGEAGIWNTDLLPVEIQALAAGVSPLLIRPGNLVAYWPLIRSVEDRLGGYEMTVNGTVNVVPHPRVIYPYTPITYFIPSAGGGTTINASLESITLTEHLSSVALDKSISAALESILLTENQANADLDKNINGSVESIALTALSSTVQADVDTNVSAAQESIQVNELSASISLGSGISAVLESITLAELPGNITLDKNISAATESISVSESAAQITLGSTVSGLLEGITVTANQAGVTLDVIVNASQESISINHLAAMLGLSKNINAVKENITLAESGATLTLDKPVSGAQEQIALSTFFFTLTSSASTPTQPGLEYTIPVSKMGYTIPINKIHFTFREED